MPVAKDVVIEHGHAIFRRLCFRTDIQNTVMLWPHLNIYYCIVVSKEVENGMKVLSYPIFTRHILSLNKM